MKKELQYSKVIGVFVLVADFFLLDLVTRLAYYARYETSIDYVEYYGSFALLFRILWVVAWLAVVVFNNLNILGNLFSARDLLTNFAYTLLLHLFILAAYIVSFGDVPHSRIFLAIAYGLTVICLLTFRAAFVLVLRYFIHVGRQDRRVVIVGANYAGNELYHYFISNKSLGYKFMGFFDDTPELTHLIVKGKLSHLKDYCLNHGITEIYYALSLTSAHLIKDLTDFADQHFIYFKIAPDFRGLLQRKVNIDFYDKVPIMTFRQEPLQVWLNRAVKRGFDIVFSGLVILLIFPWLFPLVALCIKLDSRGPVIFRQHRSGRRNQAFICYKFRTMREESDEARRKRVYGGHRVTRVGAFLRKTSIDELPQFINVLLGQMSVVGPRPHMLQHTEEYSRLIEKYLVRHFVSPGITGYAQVHGLRGEITDPYLMKKRLEYDTWYMENWSLPLDVKIIFMTITNVLRGEENAY